MYLFVSPDISKGNFLEPCPCKTPEFFQGETYKRFLPLVIYDVQKQTKKVMIRFTASELYFVRVIFLCNTFLQKGNNWKHGNKDQVSGKMLFKGEKASNPDVYSTAGSSFEGYCS